MSGDLAATYEAVIIDHRHHPHNFRKLKDAARAAQGVNPLCGNELTVCLELTDGRSNGIAFQGSRGASSQTSASLMTTAPTGKGEEEALAPFGDFHATMTERSDSEVGLANQDRFAVLAGVTESRYRSRVQRSHGTHVEVPSTSTMHGSPGSRHR